MIELILKIVIFTIVKLGKMEINRGQNNLMYFACAFEAKAYGRLFEGILFLMMNN